MAKNNVAIKKAQAAKASNADSASSPTTTATISTSTKKPLSNTISQLYSALDTTIKDYFASLTPKLKLIDIFLAFLVSLGVLQFGYVLLIGNFPFNAFLGGFAICVGQFVLLVSLRLQINDGERETKPSHAKPAVKAAKVGEEKIKDVDDAKEVEEIAVEDVIGDEETSFFKSITPERSFADFIFASLILHFIVIHFIN
ncbi:uncharacterized protein LODBEIA_P37950 [Lodderomyces beijingensis]|uniref:Dolichyl-diphosphooligosaccharide--protein glycosyltransferase subunit OST2 n=1 Tax=Lodderomyces beijingensis TaxID=1775926 RepID=A0ABP0ZRN1_9ASCO